MTDLTPLSQYMGIEVLHVSAELASASMPVAPNRQPMGRLAGGASLALCEGIASRAANVHAHLHGSVAVGLEVNATHHRAAREGVVVATATAVHLGRTVATYDVKVTDEAQRLITSARVTCIVITPSHEAHSPGSER